MNFFTFSTDAITKMDSQSRWTSIPEFSFSFNSLQDFTLADCLKMPFVRGPFWLRKESMSYEEAKEINEIGALHIRAQEQVLAFSGCQKARVCALKDWSWMDG